MAATRAGAGGNLPRTGWRVALVISLGLRRGPRLTAVLTALATARRTVRLTVFSLDLRTGTIGYLSW